MITGIAPRWESPLATLLGASQQAHLVRRCADVAELVGVARAGLARVALVSSDLRGLDREVVAALQEAGVHVVGVQPPGDEDGARMLRRWGVGVVIATDVSVQDLDLALTSLDQPEGTLSEVDLRAEGGGDPGADRGTGEPPGQSSQPGAHRGPGTTPTSGPRPDDGGGPELAGLPTGAPGVAGASHPDPDGIPDDSPDRPERPVRGEVIVVWGAYGSPGRTTVAVNLAAELASPLEPVILVDADTYAASVAQWLAVLDEAPGIAAAARAADQGTLDSQTLHRLAPQVWPGLSVLTGLPRADRWPELRDASLADVLEQCREIARWVVVDVAPVTEQDEELSFDTRAPRRNGATLTALASADRVVVVGTGDPVGLHRLVRCLDVLPALTAGVRDVVVTCVRPGPVGPEPERRIRESLSRFAGADTVHLIPDDRDSLDAALLHGRLLVEVRPHSAVRPAVQKLVAVIRGTHSRHLRARASWRETLLRRR